MKQSIQGMPEDQFAGCGEQLKRAREAAGLTVDDVSSRVKMPVKIVHAIEAEDWAVLGAPVFVRGQLRSYARLLGVDLEPQLQLAPATALPPSHLVSHTHTPRYRRVAEHASRRLVYIVLTAAILAPVIIASRSHLADKPLVESLDAFPEAPQVEAEKAAAPAESHRTPVVASMTGIQAPAVPAPALAFTFSGDSWVQVYGADGGTLEKGLLTAGERRTYQAGQVGRVVLGNSTAVQVEQAGKPVDLAPFSRGSVARFTLSSDGSLAPVVD